MAPPLTLMAVHAHPDDESSSTGGIIAKYSDEGIRTVLVTCTNGEYGDGPGGVKPGAEGHDPEQVARTRLRELEQASEILGVTDLELLGYHDSGMPDWDYKDRPEAFSQVPADEGVDRLAKLFERYRPDVVVTYDDYAAYNHPDHIQASKITIAAVERTGIPRKAYFTAIRRSSWQRFREILEESGVEMPEFPDPDSEWVKRMDALEQRITTTVDITPYVERKRLALATHASQIEESLFAHLPAEAYSVVFGTEHFIRAVDVSGAAVPEDDLFAGLR